ncbi:hypothetical protein BGZ63DRAFT_450210 [Mariannaea sp. PMI_226]|nr:hypothetical protein BGZ63DRAFT_450210 [Mariannaea sp. PMI_226]
MMATSHRPLLPKGLSYQDRNDTDQTGVLSRPRANARRPPNTTTACNVCRRRKTKCDGRQPVCSSCLKYGAVCAYSARRRPLQTLEADRDEILLQLSRTLSRDNVAEVLKLLRTFSADTAPELLETLGTLGWESSGDFPMLSEHCLLRGLLAPACNDLEFELMVRHPISFPPLFPLQVASLSLKSLLRPSRISATQQPCDSNKSSGQWQTQVTTLRYPTRALVDHRLLKLEMKNWTEVPISNELAAHIISFYIETDYQTLPFFELDLFIKDLISNRPHFCSRLLVNALFSWTCQAYTAISSEAYLLGQAFFKQAQQLIPDGPDLITLTAVSALQFLCIAAAGYGQDHLAHHFLRQSVAIGKRMGLFGVSSEVESAGTWLGSWEDWNKNASYTAWGVYNWVSLFCLRYHTSEIDVPPKIPMPGSLDLKPETESLETTTPSTDVEVFTACCKLWVISNDVTQKYRHGYSTQSPSQQLQVAEQTFRRLLAWGDALPLSLVRRDQSTHAVIMMHIYYHAIVADLFRHFLPISDDHLRLRSFSTLQATPRAIYTASINQLKRLLVFFRLSFKMASLSILSQTVLIYVFNAVVREAHRSDQLEWHFYLQVCLAALEDLYGCYRESWSVTRGLLCIAMERGAITRRKAEQIASEMMVLGDHYSTCAEVDTRSMIDLDLAVINPAAARVSSLASKYEEQMLEKRSEAGVDA